ARRAAAYEFVKTATCRWRGTAMDRGVEHFAAPYGKLPDQEDYTDNHRRHEENEDQPGRAVGGAHQVLTHSTADVGNGVKDCLGSEEPSERDSESCPIPKRDDRCERDRRTGDIAAASLFRADHLAPHRAACARSCDWPSFTA